MKDTGTVGQLKKTGNFYPELQSVFFEAMADGYATGKPKKGTIKELPGSKVIAYVREPWTVKDVYLVTPLSTRSGGTTTIFCEDIPVWMMQYFGQYEEEVIPCLKAALREAYSKSQFWAGRGPWQFELGEYVYKNNVFNPLGLASFAGFFSGKETVFKKSDMLGWHQYQGGIM